MQIQKCSAVGTNYNKKSNPNFGWTVLPTEDASKMLEAGLRKDQMASTIAMLEGIGDKNHTVDLFFDGSLFGIRSVTDPKIPQIYDKVGHGGGFPHYYPAAIEKMVKQELLPRINGTMGRYKPYKEPVHLGPTGGA